MELYQKLLKGKEAREGRGEGQRRTEIATLCGVGCALRKEGLGARLWRFQVTLYLP